MWFSFGQNVLAPQEQLGVPERLGALELIGVTEGPEALAQIGKLHGTDIELVSAYILEYVHGTERGTVWVSKAESRDAAAELIGRMLDGIEKGGSGFSNLRQLTVAGHKVFQVDGPGGEHFFYNSGEMKEQVVWLSIEASDTLSILEEALKNF